MATLRTELTSLPKRMRDLPIDERGYPVPWFVNWIEKDGKKVPEFRAMDGEKWVMAVRFRLCWVCGEKLGRWLTFVAGPMCGINRTSSEPPCHYECAEWSAINCPFLANPNEIRRIDETVPNVAEHKDIVGGFAITRNPGVVMLWTCTDYTVFPDFQRKGGKLIHMGEPEHVYWFAEGKPATREQVLLSVETGLPILEKVASTEAGGLEYLAKERARFEQYVPA